MSKCGEALHTICGLEPYHLLHRTSQVQNIIDSLRRGTSFGTVPHLLDKLLETIPSAWRKGVHEHNQRVPHCRCHRWDPSVLTSTQVQEEHDIEMADMSRALSGE